MNPAYAIQLAASAVAVAVLVGLAAWAKIGRPTPPLEEAITVSITAKPTYSTTPPAWRTGPIE